MRKENTMDELISRQVLLDKFEKWQKTEDYSNDEWNLLVDVLSVIKSMPPAPQLSTNLAEVGTDCISRQAAIDAIEAEKIKHGDYLTSSYVGYEMAEKVVKQLPPIQPKSGRWILDRSGAYCCSECMEPCATYVMMQPRDKYCKMCGSRNEVTE